MTGKTLGQARIKYDGGILETDGSSTIELGGPKREPVNGDYIAGKFKETQEPGKVEANVLITPGLSLDAVRRIDNATVTVELDTGQTYIFRNAWVADVVSFATNDGKAKIVFQGPPAEELL